MISKYSNFHPRGESDYFKKRATYSARREHEADSPYVDATTVYSWCEGQGTSSQTGETLCVLTLVVFLNIIRESFLIKERSTNSEASFFYARLNAQCKAARVQTRVCTLKYFEQSFKYPHIILTANVSWSSSLFF